MTDRELMCAHVDALFTHRSDGRMLRVNEPQGKDAPRFFLGKTTSGHEWRVRHDVHDDLWRTLESMCEAEPTGELIPATPAPYEQVLAPVLGVWSGPAYRFPTTLPTSAAVRITEANRDLLRTHLEGWLGDVAPDNPMFAYVAGGCAVSVCCSVRMTAAAHEAGVETAPDFRGNGYASHVVTAWARAVRDLGRAPLYSTSWSNVASQAVARSAGLILFGVDLHIT